MKLLRLLVAYVWLMVRAAGKRAPGRRPSHSVRSATCFVCLLSVVGNGATSSPADAARNAPSEVVAPPGLAISTPSTNSRSSRLSMNDLAAFAYDAPGRVTTSDDFVATKAVAPGGQKVALGLSEGLDDFAASQGAVTYRQFSTSGNFADDFVSTVGNPNNKVVFNLDGVRSPWSSVQRVGDMTLDSAMRSGASITDWELAQIYRNSWSHVQFYKGGRPVASPFG